MSPLSHPDEKTLAAYAAGDLRPGFDLVVAAHLEACPACRAAVRRCEAVAGELLEALPAQALSAEALPHAMARLERETPSFVAPDRTAAPKSLAERLPYKPRRWLGPGNWIQALDVDHAPGDKLYLLHVAPGLSGLDHSHAGLEFTTVLQGALRDGDRVYKKGDFIASDADVRHQPLIEPDDGGCTCLVASEGSLVTRDWLSGLIRVWAGV